MGLIKKVDAGISKAFKFDKVITRPSASPGAWIIFLLPTAVLLTAILTKVSSTYQLCAVFSVNLLLNGIVLLVNIVKYETLSVSPSLHSYCIIPVLICSTANIWITKLDVFRAVCHSVANSLLYFEAVPYILKVFPKSFTFGEANVAAQALSYFVYGSYVRLNRVLISSPSRDDFEIATSVLQVVLLMVLLLCLVPKEWSSSKQILALFTAIASIIPLTNFILHIQVIYWVLDFIFTEDRLRLICGWAICSGLAWGTVVMQIRSKRKATTDLRKIFHILAVLVFMSGILLDPLMLYFAAGMVFPAFLVIEFIRIRNLPPISGALQQGFHVYADEKDSGGVALTPIYLLVGCSLPLWILPDVRGEGYTLPLLAGVLSIGVGDSLASIIGKNFGKHKWLGTKKTIEGTVACAAGQGAAILLLSSLGYLPNVSAHVLRLARALVAVCVASLVEAKTDQVDNIVLPLVTYICLL